MDIARDTSRMAGINPKRDGRIQSKRNDSQQNDQNREELIGAETNKSEPKGANSE